MNKEINPSDQINWQNRLNILGENYGFYPTSLAESTRAHMIIPFLEEPGKTAKHLNEVLIRSKRDPRAVRSVVRTFGDYAIDAKVRTARLEDFRQEVELTNPHIRVEQAEEAREHPGLIDVLQFHDILLAAESGDSGALRSKEVVKDGVKKQRTNYELDICNDALITVLTDPLQRIRIIDARDMAADAISSHTVRNEFWIERLVESRIHAVARPIAESLLAELVEE